MFDDNKEPEDIFSQADKVVPQVAPPTAPLAAPASAQSIAPASAIAPGAAPVSTQPSIEERIAAISPTHVFPWKPIVLVVAIIVVVGAAFYLSVQILGSRTPVTPEPPVGREVGNSEQGTGISEQGAGIREQEVEEAVEEEVVVPSTADTDKDGLTDEEEATAGTSSRAADTDGDGLFDPEEIRTWETDPLNPDTDGDGYLDGEEVSGGYNPNGEGKLIAAPTESD
jgi:hypothetical protein